MSTRAESRAGTAQRAPGRGFWAMRDLPTLFWFVAIVVVAVIHRELPRPGWLLLHLLFLGASTHAILVWSQHFASALLRRPPTPGDRRAQNWRLILANLGTVAVLVGVLVPVWAVTIAGAVLVGAAAIWHGASLVRRMRGALPGRFSGSVRYYVLAAACLPIGAGLGAWIAGPTDAGGGLTLAHALINLLGWLGLTIAGTIVTLWPTMLRTKADDGAAAGSLRALPVLGGATLVASIGAAANLPLVIAIGLTAYLVGLGLIAVSLWRAARTSPPRSFATLSAGAALLWWAVGVSLLVWVSLTAGLAELGVSGLNATGVASGMEAGVGVGVEAGAFGASGIGAVRAALSDVAPYLAAGFIAQLLIGALSYLVPVVLGGGPRAVRAGTAVFDRLGTLRVTVANAALVVCALPVTSLTRVVASLLYLVAVASFIPLMMAAMRAQRRVKHETAGGSALPMPTVRAGGPIPPDPVRPDREPAPHRSAQATAGLIALALTVVLCASFAPHTLGPVAAGSAAGSAGGAAGLTNKSAGANAPVQTVQIEATADMRFDPDHIEVPAGTHLIIELTNSDPEQTHDLVLANGAASGRLSPGETETIDAGVLTEPTDGWCSIVGHKQMGMVLEIEVTGEAASGEDSQSFDATHGERGTGQGTELGSRARSTPLALADIDLAAKFGPGFTPHPAALSSLEARGPTTHKLTLRAQEAAVEVAPGATQRLWTFGDSAPGPTLHGRVGDTFEVTLINDGTIGHSIDFHAGALAPDEPMRTIAPGEELTYTFTAARSGIWLYHCSTHPMSAHIANGMFGAVIIEPEELPAVDQSYVLVQSEFYLGPEGGEVDMQKLLDEAPDLVTFNGVAAQYQQYPLPARVGERTRVWVLDAGPNRASSFHVVGGQFDTVWSEGRYLVNRAESTGSQALALQPAQGGFVELTFPEVGHYPFVSHIMIDAERGAAGVFRVTE